MLASIAGRQKCSDRPSRSGGMPSLARIAHAILNFRPQEELRHRLAAAQYRRTCRSQRGWCRPALLRGCRGRLSSSVYRRRNIRPAPSMFGPCFHPYHSGSRQIPSWKAIAIPRSRHARGLRIDDVHDGPAESKHRVLGAQQRQIDDATNAVTFLGYFVAQQRQACGGILNHILALIRGTNYQGRFTRNRTHDGISRKAGSAPEAGKIGRT